MIDCLRLNDDLKQFYYCIDILYKILVGIILFLIIYFIILCYKKCRSNDIQNIPI